MNTIYLLVRCEFGLSLTRIITAERYATEVAEFKKMKDSPKFTFGEEVKHHNEDTYTLTGIIKKHNNPTGLHYIAVKLETPDDLEEFKKAVEEDNAKSEVLLKAIAQAMRARKNLEDSQTADNKEDANSDK